MKNKKILLITILSVILFFLLSIFYVLKFAKLSSVEPPYPTLYGVKPPTLATTESDSRFIRKEFSKDQSLLANVKSAIKKDSPVIEDIKPIGELENSSWLWTPTEFLTDEYIKDVIKGARENKINKIYLAIDSYLDIYVQGDGEEKDRKIQEFNENISRFIKLANIYNIKISAVSGWKNWARKEHNYKPFVIMDYVINFNLNRQEKFDGIQFDIEPYLLDEYKENKKEILKEFISLVDEIFKNAPEENLPISIVIPEFYDGESKLTPKFLYNGNYDFTTNHLLKILTQKKDSSIVVMSYRNFTTGYDGVFDISKNEIESAKKYKVKILIAQETGDFPPSYITYYNTSKNYYLKKSDEIKEYYKNTNVFAGIATHYLNTFIEMK